jgi:hypothetical protein
VLGKFFGENPETAGSVAYTGMTELAKVNRAINAHIKKWALLEEKPATALSTCRF